MIITIIIIIICSNSDNDNNRKIILKFHQYKITYAIKIKKIYMNNINNKIDNNKLMKNNCHVSRPSLITPQMRQALGTENTTSKPFG